MSTEDKATFIPGIPFYLNMPANATQIYDSLRLGRRVKALRTVYLCGFQSERKEGGINCPQGGLSVEPKGVFLVDDSEEGGSAIFFWGKCISFTPHVGNNQKTVNVEGYVSGRINLTHGSGFFLFSECPLGLEQIKDPSKTTPNEQLI